MSDKYETAIIVAIVVAGFVVVFKMMLDYMRSLRVSHSPSSTVIFVEEPSMRYYTMDIDLSDGENSKVLENIDYLKIISKGDAYFTMRVVKDYGEEWFENGDIDDGFEIREHIKRVEFSAPPQDNIVKVRYGVIGRWQGTTLR